MEAPVSLRRSLLLAAALAVGAGWPAGPLAFLPPALRWPLVAAAAAAALARPGPRIGWLLEHGAALLVLLTFVLLKVPSLHAGWSDQNAYFYMAVRVAGGELPYRDFFFAHPPIHLVVPASVFAVTGFSTGVARAIPLVAQLAAGTLLWRAARRASPLLGIAALTLHLTAYQVLMTASEMDGANIAMAFTMAALLAVVAGRPALGGGLAGLAAATALYAGAGVGAVAVAAFLRGRRAALWFGAALAGSLALIMGTAWALGGDGFLAGVFGYHALKAAGAGRAVTLGAGGLGAAVAGWLHNLGVDLAGDGAVRSLALQAPILCAAAVGGLALAGARLRRATRSPDPAGATAAIDLGLVGAAGAALSAVQQAGLAEVYPFYSTPAFPWLALLGGYGAWRAWQGSSGPPRAMAWAAAGLVGLALQTPLARWATGRAFAEESVGVGERVEYAWRDPEVLVGLSHLSRSLFWDDHRVRGTPVPGYRQALWNEQYAFSTLREVVARVRAGSSPDETITGGSMIAPLVALEAGRRLAADEVDTNQKRFAAGLLTDAELLRRALADRVRFVLASPRSHFTEQLMERDPGWSAHFERDAVFLDPALARSGPVRLVLYRRRGPG